MSRTHVVTTPQTVTPTAAHAYGLSAVLWLIGVGLMVSAIATSSWLLALAGLASATASSCWLDTGLSRARRRELQGFSSDTRLESHRT